MTSTANETELNKETVRVKLMKQLTALRNAEDAIRKLAEECCDYEISDAQTEDSTLTVVVWKKIPIQKTVDEIHSVRIIAERLIFHLDETWGMNNAERGSFFINKGREMAHKK